MGKVIARNSPGGGHCTPGSRHSGQAGMKILRTCSTVWLIFSGRIQEFRYFRRTTVSPWGSWMVTCRNPTGMTCTTHYPNPSLDGREGTAAISLGHWQYPLQCSRTWKYRRLFHVPPFRPSLQHQKYEKAATRYIRRHRTSLHEIIHIYNLKPNKIEKWKQLYWDPDGSQHSEPAVQ